MRYIQFGDRRVSAIGLGTWQFGSRGWGWGRDLDAEQAKRIVRRAMDLGITFFDTAEIYGRGRSEEILGEALRGHREEVFIATKVFPHHLTRGGVVRAAQRSLRRLGTDTIDLYQVHFPNPLIPLSQTMGGMSDLMNEGLVRQVGVSNFGLGRWQRAERALGSAVISNQVHYHLLKRKAMDTLLPYAREEGRVVIAYSPLAQGVLAGRYGPGDAPGGVRARNVLFTPRNLLNLGPFMEVLRSVAGVHGATPAQIALAWLIHDPQVIAIPGVKSVEQVEENVAAADIALSDAEWARLGDAARAFRRTSFISAVPGMITRYLRP